MSFSSAGIAGSGIASVYIGGDNLANPCQCKIANYRLYLNNIPWGSTYINALNMGMMMAGELSNFFSINESQA